MLLKRCTLLAFLYWCCIHPLSAQHISQTVSMPYIALGTYSSAQADAFAFTINPAALAQQKAPAAGVYTERRFLLSEATAYRAALALPTRMGHWGLQLNRFGFTHFSENALALAYARSLGRKVELGIQFSYHGYQVFTHGNASTIGSAAGVLLHLTPRLQAGIAVCNPIAMPFSQASGHKLATAVRLGMGYEASEQLLLTADIRKEEGSALHTTVGVQYQMGQHLFARGGFVSATPQMLMGFAGLGVGWQQWRLHLSGSWHPQLRWSPALVCLVQFKQRTNAQP